MGVTPLVTPSMVVGQATAAGSAVSTPSSPELASRFASLLDSKVKTAASAAPSTVSAPELAAGESDSLLQGLERLRNTFDAQEARISELMSGEISDVDRMLAMQMELTNYSILIDVTSKLASKAAQGLDTLMKGS